MSPLVISSPIHNYPSNKIDQFVDLPIYLTHSLSYFSSLIVPSLNIIVDDLINSHAMTTRFKLGIFKSELHAFIVHGNVVLSSLEYSRVAKCHKG